MRVTLHETGADSWLNVRFAGVPGVREDVSHVWLVPAPDGIWRLSFEVDRPAAGAQDAQRLLDLAWGTGFCVRDADGGWSEVRGVQDLGWSDGGVHRLGHSRDFPSLAAARTWLTAHGDTLFALADEPSLHEAPGRGARGAVGHCAPHS